MTTIQESIDVDVPLSTAYNQWTQFEEFPRFMEGVEHVQQVTDTQLHWKAQIAGVTREWDAEIVEQVPDQRVAWRSLDGSKNDGVVTFEPVDSVRTRVSMALDFEPEGFVENVGDTLGFVRRRAEGDLERFKHFIEERGVETGEWRGSV